MYNNLKKFVYHYIGILKLYLLILWLNISVHLLLEFHVENHILLVLSLYPLLAPFIVILCKALLYYFEHHDWSDAFADCEELNHGPEKINYTKALKKYIKDSKDMLNWLLIANHNILIQSNVISLTLFFFDSEHSPITILFNIFLNVLTSDTLEFTISLCLATIQKHMIAMSIFLFYIIICITMFLTNQYLLESRKEFLICFVCATFLLLITCLTILHFLFVFVFKLIS